MDNGRAPHPGLKLVTIYGDSQAVFSIKSSIYRWKPPAFQGGAVHDPSMMLLRSYCFLSKKFPMALGYCRNSLTRQLLREAVYNSNGALSLNDSRKLVDDLLSESSTVLGQGDMLKLQGFGTFRGLLQA